MQWWKTQESPCFSCGECQEMKIEDMAFETILASVNSGKADFGAAGMTVTPEREESVDFTDTYANATQVVIVRK